MLNIAPSHHIVCDCAPALGRGRQSRRCRTLHKDPKAISFDYLVGGGQQCRWYREAERLGGFQINTIFERELCTGSQQNGPLMSQLVESRMGAVAWGLWPTPRFPSPLIGRVEDWRAGLGRCSCSLLSRPFVCECHSISTMPRFQSPPRRTQRADFPLYALLFASPQGLWDLSCRGDFRP